MASVPSRPDRTAPPRLESYEQARSDFRLDLPDHFNPVVDIVERWAEEAPGDLALVSLGPDGETVAEQTAADLAREARRAARALLALGVKRGDPIFIMLPRIPAWYAAMLGAIRIGAVAMPAPNQLTSRDIAYRLRSSDAVVTITDAVGAEKVDAIDEELGALTHRVAWKAGARDGWKDLGAMMDDAGDGEVPGEPFSKDDPMILFFTSGTVSYAKMVIHPMSYGLGHVSTARFWHDLRPGDRHWTVSDTGWAKAAWGGLFGQWHERATVVQVALGKPDADTILSILGKAQITSFCAPPTLYRLLVQADLAAYDLSTLRHCTSAGEPLNPEVIRAWKQGTGDLTVYDGYGQSETTVLVANYRAVPVRPGSMGFPVPGWTVDVLDDAGAPAADDVVGNIAVQVTDRGPSGSSSATTTTSRPRAARSATAGTTPGTRRGATPTATSGSRTRRRRHHVVGLPDRPLRGRVRAHRARGGRRGRGGRQGRPGADTDRDGVRGPRARSRALGRARRGAAAPYARADRPVQVPARDPLRHRAAQDGERQDSSHRAARLATHRDPAAATE